VPLKSIINNETHKIFQDHGVEFNSTTAGIIPSYTAMRRMLHNQRRKTTPKLPQSIKEIDLPDKYRTTSYGQPFLLFDTYNKFDPNDKAEDRIIAFASNHQLICLENCSTWHVDGTFSTSPQLFYQMYVIGGSYKDEFFPCVFVFLKNKSQESYQRMIQRLLKINLRILNQT
jgi:hypothetical protein